MQEKVNPFEAYRQRLINGEVTPAERGKILTPREKLTKKIAEATAAGKPLSRKVAIDAYCYECQGEDYDSSWKWRIGNCSSTNCPLYIVRPYIKLYAGKPMPIGLAKELSYSEEELIELRKEHAKFGSSGEDDVDEGDDQGDEA